MVPRYGEAGRPPYNIRETEYFKLYIIHITLGHPLVCQTERGSVGGESGESTEKSANVLTEKNI